MGQLRLSFSQVQTASNCMARWGFEKRYKLPQTTNVNAVMGQALHEGVATYYRKKMGKMTGADPSTVFADHLYKGCEDPQIKAKTTTQEIDNLWGAGTALITKYIDEIGQHITPKIVEGDVGGFFGDISITGRVDLMDDQGVIVDLKSAERTPAGIDPSEIEQLAFYALLIHGKRPEEMPEVDGQIHYLVKGKITTLVETVRLTHEDYRFAFSHVQTVAQVLQNIDFLPPNRSKMNFLCSHSACSFAAACEQMYGGRVRGSA